MTTVAGTTWTFPATPLAAVNAPLGGTAGVALDGKGNISIADPGNNMVFRVAANGILTVVAGNGTVGFSGDGGPATSAALAYPKDVAIDSAGNLYFTDVLNARVRKVSDGIITTVAGNGTRGYSGDGGPATSASLYFPQGLAVDSAGNLFITDDGENSVRKVSNGIITTVAGGGTNGLGGNGPATSASLNSPLGVAVDSTGNLYIADTANNRVRKVSGGIITTVAGGGMNGSLGDGGPATNAFLNGPVGVTVDQKGNLYIADTGNNRIRMVSSGIITTVAGDGTPGFAGDGGPASAASLDEPTGVALDAEGDLYISDSGNERIRTVASGTGIISTIAGDGAFKFSGDGGLATSASLDSPYSVAEDAGGNLYIADTGNARVRRVSNGILATVVGKGVGTPSPGTGSIGQPVALAVDSSGSLYIAADGIVLKFAGGSLMNIAGNGNYQFSGDEGPAVSAGLDAEGLAVDAAGNLYIADEFNNRIRKVSAGTITTVAGNGMFGFSGDDGPATSAELAHPTGVAVDSAGNLYVADMDNNRIREVSAGKITTVAGEGMCCSGGFSGDGGPATSAELNSQSDVALDSSGNLFIADAGNNRIREVSAGIINTVAGNGTTGFSGDGGLATDASLDPDPNVVASGFFPARMTIDRTGNLYIVDSGNDRVRAVFPAPQTLTISPASLSFAATSGGSAPPTQSIAVSSSLSGLSFAVSTNTSWLNATPSSGVAPGTVQVSADPSQLPANTYNGSVMITGPNGLTQAANVTFNVGAPVAGSLTVSTLNVSFSATQGSGPASLQLTVSNQGGGSIAFTATASTSTGGNWLQVLAASETVTPTTPASLTVTATPGTLAAGTYSGSIVVSSATTGESITLTATLAISAVQQTILLSQTGLTFTAVAQGGTPLPQSFGILNTGQGSMNWSASATTLSPGSWLSIDQSSGTVTTPYTDVSLLNVSVTPAGLPAGNYYGQIQVSSPGVPNSPQSVSVVLNVLPAGSSPGAEVRPAGLIFVGESGSSPGSQNVMISNPQASSITFGAGFLTVPTGENWAQILPLNATVQPNAPISMLVQPDYTNLTGGVYQGFVSLGFLDGSSRSVHVLAVVTAGQQGAGGAAQFSQASQASGSCSPIQIQPTSLTDPGSSVTIGVPASLQVRAVDACGNLVTSSNGAVAATFNDGDASVDLVHEGNGNWSGTWTPRNGASTQVQITYKAFEGSGVTLLSGTTSITVAVHPANGTPLTLGSANAASGFGAYIAPGGLVSIYGQGLAAQAVTNGNLPFSTDVNGTQALMGGVALPLRYVGPNQINAQVPFGLGINTHQQLVVQNGTALSAPQSLIVAAAQPAIYTQDESGTGPGVILDYNTGKEVSVGNPASIGDTLTIYCNGLGAVNPSVPTGTPAPSVEPLARTVNPVTVTIGGVNAEVEFAGLSPGFPDLYQVNAVVPDGITPGNQVAVTLTVVGQTSPPVTIAVQ